jgi:hypothetical protein
MAATQQSFKNHARLDPAFHFFLVPVSMILLIGAVTNVVNSLGWSSGWHLLAVLWGIVAVFKIRLYSLKVQDRVIRLEERLRLQRVLSEPLRGRIAQLSEDQLIGLRFASEPELPGLVEKTLSGNWDRKKIKQAVQNWQPDLWRV